MGRILKIAAIALGLIVGWQHFTGPDKPAAVAGQSADIEIYTTRSCGVCKRAKAYMDEHGIEYLEKDVEGDIELRREFYARGGRGVPLIVIYGEIMSGFDAADFERLRAKGS